MDTQQPSPQKQRFRYFTLQIQHNQQALLPEQHVLIVDTHTGYALQLNGSTQEIQGAAHLEEQECHLFLILLTAWPSYVPYEQMLCQLDANKRLDDLKEELAEIRGAEQAEEQRRQQLQEKTGPVRIPLEACLTRLQEQFSLSICAVADYGYLLVRFVEHPQSTPASTIPACH